MSERFCARCGHAESVHGDDGNGGRLACDFVAPDRLFLTDEQGNESIAFVGASDALTELPTKRIRYIFTIATTALELPEHPLGQKVFLDEMLRRLKECQVSIDRIGVVAVMD